MMNQASAESKTAGEELLSRSEAVSQLQSEVQALKLSLAEREQ